MIRRHGRLSCSKLVLWFGLVLVLLVVALVLFAPDLTVRMYLAYTRHSLLSGARPGMSRAEVIRNMGPAQYVARSIDELTVRSQAGGYSPIPRDPIEKEVLEYYSGVWKLFVYIGHNDRVTKIRLART